MRYCTVHGEYLYIAGLLLRNQAAGRNFKSSDLNGIIKVFCLVILKNIKTCLTCMYTGYS